MEPQVYTIAVDSSLVPLLKWVFWIVTVLAAWFLGQWYKARRLRGMTRDEILQDLGYRAHEIVGEGLTRTSDAIPGTTDDQILGALKKLLDEKFPSAPGK